MPCSPRPLATVHRSFHASCSRNTSRQKKLRDPLRVRLSFIVRQASALLLAVSQLSRSKSTLFASASRAAVAARWFSKLLSVRLGRLQIAEMPIYRLLQLNNFAASSGSWRLTQLTNLRVDLLPFYGIRVEEGGLALAGPPLGCIARFSRQSQTRADLREQGLRRERERIGKADVASDDAAPGHDFWLFPIDRLVVRAFGVQGPDLRPDGSLRRGSHLQLLRAAHTFPADGGRCSRRQAHAADCCDALLAAESPVPDPRRALHGGKRAHCVVSMNRRLVCPCRRVSRSSR